MSDCQKFSNRSLWYSTIGLVGTGVVAGAFVGFFFGDMAAIVVAMVAMTAIMMCAYGKSKSGEALRQSAEQTRDSRP